MYYDSLTPEQHYGSQGAGWEEASMLVSLGGITKVSRQVFTQGPASLHITTYFICTYPNQPLLAYTHTMEPSPSTWSFLAQAIPYPSFIIDQAVTEMTDTGDALSTGDKLSVNFG